MAGGRAARPPYVCEHPRCWKPAMWGTKSGEAMCSRHRPRPEQTDADYTKRVRDANRAHLEAQIGRKLP